MDETIPIPVTTTRRMICLARFRVVALYPAVHRPRKFIPGAPLTELFSGLHRRVLLKKSDLQIACAIDNLAIGRKPPIGHAKHELGAHHPLHVDVVLNLGDIRQHLAGEFQIAKTKRAPASGAAAPAEEEANHLPQCIEAEAARHHRVAIEVAAEKPQNGYKVEFRPTDTLAPFAARQR